MYVAPESESQGQQLPAAALYLCSTRLRQTPSPVKYPAEGTNRGKSYSFISKHKEDSFIPESLTPGPGTYNNHQDTDPATGRRFNSKFKYAGTSSPTDQRFRPLERKCKPEETQKLLLGQGATTTRQLSGIRSTKR